MKYFTITVSEPGIMVKVLKGFVCRTPFKFYLNQKQKDELLNLLRVQALGFKVEEIPIEEYEEHMKNIEEQNKKIPKSKKMGGSGDLNINLKING